MSTGQTIALIKALSSGGGGGGGGSEEQFQQVYTTTLAEASSEVMITSEDMGGAFVDVVVCMDSLTPFADAADIAVVFAADAEGEVSVYEKFVSLSANASWSAVVSVVSNGGLLFLSQTVLDTDLTMESGFLPIVYPAAEVPGVALVDLFSEPSFPAGTTIIVYARKKVA